MPETTYLGDGVYASFDGYQIRLSTRRDDGTDVIYLDQDTYVALTKFFEELDGLFEEEAP